MSLYALLEAAVLTMCVAHAFAAARALKHHKAGALQYIVLVPLVFAFWPLVSLRALWAVDDAD